MSAAMKTIPELEHHCGSWVVVSRATGQSVAEIFDRRIAAIVNLEKYELHTAAQWLAKLNNEKYQ